MSIAAIVPVSRNTLGLKYPLELHMLPNRLTPFDLTLAQVGGAPITAIYVPAPGAVIGELAARYGRTYEGKPIIYLELEAEDGQDLLRAVNRGCFFASQREDVSKFVVVPPGYAYEFAGAVAAVVEAGFPVMGALGGGLADGVWPDFNVNGKSNVVATVGTPADRDTWRGNIGPFTLTSDEAKRLRRYRRFTIEESQPERDRAALAIAINLDIANGNTYAYVKLPGRFWDLSKWPGLNWYQEDILEGRVK